MGAGGSLSLDDGEASGFFSGELGDEIVGLKVRHFHGEELAGMEAFAVDEGDAVDVGRLVSGAGGKSIFGNGRFQR